MFNLSHKELKAVAKIRGIKDYKRMSEDELLKVLIESEKPKEPKTIKEIRKENYDSDEILRDLRALYESEEDYYEPIRINSAFNDNHIKCQSNGDKEKTLSIKEYLNMIKPDLSNIINDHKEEWKIQLLMEANFLSSKDSNESHTIII